MEGKRGNVKRRTGCILTLSPGRSADFPVRSNVERQEGFRRLLEPWEVRGLLRTGKSALRWRCQDAPIQVNLAISSLSRWQNVAIAMGLLPESVYGPNAPT